MPALRATGVSDSAVRGHWLDSADEGCTLPRSRLVADIRPLGGPLRHTCLPVMESRTGRTDETDMLLESHTRKHISGLINPRVLSTQYGTCSSLGDPNGT